MEWADLQDAWEKFSGEAQKPGSPKPSKLGLVNPLNRFMFGFHGFPLKVEGSRRLDCKPRSTREALQKHDKAVQFYINFSLRQVVPQALSKRRCRFGKTLETGKKTALSSACCCSLPNT